MVRLGRGQSPLGYAEAQAPRFVRELQEFVRMPSVSSDPAYKQDLGRCASWLASHLRRIGIDSVRLIETEGHPIVTARIDVSPSKPTLLIYGHYDVQPVKPESAWRFPPFSAQISGGHLFGRGAVDDKGQLFAHVKALESWFRTQGGPPCNVRIVFEGEEEIGSPHLRPFLEKYRQELKSDGAVVSDTQMRGPGQPALTIGLRGKLAFDVIVDGPAKDLHSGSFGGAVRNPAEVLSILVSGLHDREGRISVAGMYDDVRVYSLTERRRMAKSAPRAAELFQAAGVEEGWGEEGFTAYERISIRPSLSINGISGGHQGPGTKAIIPAHASAKLSFRLVPDQTPERVADLVTKHIARRCPPGVRCRIAIRESAPPVRIDRGSSIVKSASHALERTFGRTPVMLPSGGSIPVVEALDSLFSLPTALMGFALPTDALHGPNERFELKRFHQAIEASIRLLDHFSRTAGRLR
jgi:acetylornithine deacetylase/succinyl-diaminopimelate desuccinylase-like protein